MSPGNKIRLTILKLDILETDFCNEDYLEIRGDNESGHIFGVFCGKNIPADLIVGNDIWMKFRSGQIGTAKGFEVRINYGVLNFYPFESNIFN